jgi:hypothetical protein
MCAVDLLVRSVIRDEETSPAREGREEAGNLYASERFFPLPRTLRPYVSRTKIADVFSLAFSHARAPVVSLPLSLSLSLSSKELHPRAILRPLRFNTLVAGRHVHRE